MNLGKRLEYFLKGIAASLLRALLEQPAKIPQPPYHRILFLRFDVLGDMILSLPVFKATRRLLPDTRIDVLCSMKNHVLLKGTSLADHLYIFQKNPLKILRLILEIREKKYDLIINLVTRPSFTFGVVARLGGPVAVRLAGDQEEFSYFYNRIVELPPKSEIHMQKRKFLLCNEIVKEDNSDTVIPWVEYSADIKKSVKKLYKQCLTDLGVDPQRSKIVAINLSAGMARREWTLDKNVDLLKNLIPKYKNKIDGWVVLTNPAKPDEATELVRLVNSSRIIAIPPQSDFRIIMEFLTYVTALITPDTSVTHAASAAGTPVLVMTIGENVKIWDPIGVIHEIIFSDDYFSLKSLPVDKVIAGFENLMQQLKI
jgi:ADP-heptose:LPS heptosyltransferase